MRIRFVALSLLGLTMGMQPVASQLDGLSVGGVFSVTEVDKKGRMVTTLSPKLVLGEEVITSPAAGGGRPFPLPIGPQVPRDLWFETSVSFTAEDLRINKDTGIPEVKVEYGWDGVRYMPAEYCKNIPAYTPPPRDESYRSSPYDPEPYRRDRYRYEDRRREDYKRPEYYDPRKDPYTGEWAPDYQALLRENWRVRLPLRAASPDQKQLFIRITAPWRKYTKVFILTFAADSKSSTGIGVSFPMISYDAGVSGIPNKGNIALFQALNIGYIITGAYRAIGGLNVHFASEELRVATLQSKLALDVERARVEAAASGQAQASEKGESPLNPGADPNSLEIDVSRLKSSGLGGGNESQEAESSIKARESQTNPPSANLPEPKYGPDSVFIKVDRPTSLAVWYSDKPTEKDIVRRDLAPGKSEKGLSRSGATLDLVNRKGVGVKFLLRYKDNEGREITRLFNDKGELRKRGE